MNALGNPSGSCYIAGFVRPLWQNGTACQKARFTASKAGCILNDFLITREHPQMLQYVDSLQRKFCEYLAFYPKQVFVREIENRRILIGILNGEPCGYLYFGAFSHLLRVHQVAIPFDVQRRLYGAMMVSRVQELAENAGVNAMMCRCGFDLQANEFWKSLGFQCVNVVNGGVRRGRKINVWHKNINAALFELPSVEPAEGKTDASAWRKSPLRIGSQFVRGRNMDANRNLIIPTQEATDGNSR